MLGGVEGVWEEDDLWIKKKVTQKGGWMNLSCWQEEMRVVGNY